MTISLGTSASTRHLIPTLGHKVILMAVDYVGTVTTIARVTPNYFNVSCRRVEGWMSNPEVGVVSTVWLDEKTGEWVVDYMDDALTGVEINRTHGLEAALGDATYNVSDRGHAAGRW